jgi:uncharacterized protein
MKLKKVVLAGGSGYLGGVLAGHFSAISAEVIILSRHTAPARENIRTVVWDGETTGGWTVCLEGADLLVNLCGKNVNCRYTARNKAEILRSREVPTRLLGEAIGGLEQPSRLWINSSSATIYRHAEDRPQDEVSGEIGHGFSIDVCRRWEETFFGTRVPRTRKVALRIGIVLGRADSAFPRLLTLARLGMGGRQGTGTQYVSWVHEQDVARCCEWLTEHPEIEGPVNLTAPNPLTNKDLMSVIREACGMPFGLPVPDFMLRLGAVLIGTEPELVLKSRWVLPSRLLDAGYTFYSSDARHAVRDLLSIRS